MKTKYIVFLIVSLLSLQMSYSQDIENIANLTPLSLSGSVTASGIYISPIDSGSLQKKFTYYLSGSLNANLFGTVSVPLTFSYTNNELTSTLACPFNRFSLSPTWRWIKTYFGYSSMSFSQYTMSGREFMGGGVELTPPDIPFTFAAYYGRFNKSQIADSLHDVSIYRRVGGGLKIGYSRDKLQVAVNVNKASDDKSSLTFEERDTMYVAPESNISGSFEFSVEPITNLTLSCEYALSFVNPNTDTNARNYRHKAYKFVINQAFSKGSVGATYERVSPQYESFSSYYNTNDFQNITANMSANIADKISLSADVGYQVDNLESQDANTSSQLIYSVSANANITKQLSLTSSVSNIQSYVHIRDILETVTQTNQYQNLDTLSYTELNFTTSNNVNYRFGKAETFSHALTAGYSYQQASHEQENSQRFVNNRLSNYNLNYMLSHAPTKISTSLGINYNTNRIPDSESTNVLTLSASMSSVIWNDLSSSLSLNYSNVSSITDSRIVNARWALRYALLKVHSFNFSITALNNSIRDNTEFTLNLTYSYSFSRDLFKKRED